VSLRALWLSLAALGILGRTGSAAEPAPSFARQIGPLLQARCLRCHGGARPKGDLNLTTAEGLKEGGASGAVVQPGRAVDSLLYQYLRDQKMPPKQPLDRGEIELVRRWIDAGARWEGPALAVPRQASGRAGKDWWSLQPIRRPRVPEAADHDWDRTPVDAFIRTRLASRHLTPAPEADRRTLIRRVTVDLTGLLPCPEEVQAFVSDRAPDAYEKLVDRLLASPHYGERWGRHWLDVVRFAESHGYEMNTLRPNAWPYRDYVIRSFNADKSYSRFILEQLAGDIVARGDPAAEPGTGFLVGGTHDMVGNATREGQLQQRMDDLYDMVSATSSAFLGLTVNCARCHDHKFDPILQKDYYGLQAVFSGVQHAERPLPIASATDRRREAVEIRAQLARVYRQLDETEAPAGAANAPARRPAVRPNRNVERFAPVTVRMVRFVVQATVDGTEPCIDELEIYESGTSGRNVALASAGARATASSVYPNNPLHQIEHLNDGRVGNGRSWISREPGKGWVRIDLPRIVRIDRIVWGRDREQKFTDRLAREYRIEVSLDGRRWTPVAGSWDRLPYRGAAGSSGVAPPAQERRDLKRQRLSLEEKLAELDKPPMVYAGTFKASEETRVLKRGDPLQPLDRVLPSAIRAVNPPLVLDERASEGQRRVALARWLGDPSNPLPARVLVNRLWHYHFGQGLVRTPSDFGFNGDRPSHPELLDWLAAEFRASGWRLKPLHRLILLSSTYRQSSRTNAAAVRIDGDGRLCWRYPPRRLEAEALRDAILQVSGRLDRRMGGPGYHLWEYSGYVIVFQPKARLGPAEFRRMVYQFKPRTQQDETFGVFDCPDATQAMPRRNVSTTALQALNLLNSPFMQEQSEALAARLRREGGTAMAGQVRRAFLLAFGREPSTIEAAGGERLAREHGLELFSRVLLNANEFVYVH
jgi:hypothetical protein